MSDGMYLAYSLSLIMSLIRDIPKTSSSDELTTPNNNPARLPITPVKADKQIA